MLSRRGDFNGESPVMLHERELDDIIAELNFSQGADLNSLNIARFGVATITPMAVGESKKIIDHGMTYRPQFRLWNYNPGVQGFIPLPSGDYNTYADSTSIYVQRVLAQSFLPTFYYFVFSNPGSVDE